MAAHVLSRSSLGALPAHRAGLSAGACQRGSVSAVQRAGLGRARKAAVVVQANSISGGGAKFPRTNNDSEWGLDDDSFDKDTAAVVLRVLTARATQRVLMHLEELDVFVCQFLNNFAADNPPIEGNKFLLKLYAQRGSTVTDPTTGQKHHIDPQNLANQILQMREEMGRNLAGSFNSFVLLENTAVMRSHLEATSYISGNVEKGKGGNQSRRRGSGGRPRPAPPRSTAQGAGPRGAGPSHGPGPNRRVPKP